MKRIFTVLILLSCMLTLAFTANAAPAQWTGPGSNGHWYEPYVVSGGISWENAQSIAVASGGYLVTITSQAESNFLSTRITDDIYWLPNIAPGAPSVGPWTGGYQIPGSAEPGGGWQWVNGDAWSWTNWVPGQPDNTYGVEHFVNLWGVSDRSTLVWNDMGSPSWNTEVVGSYIVEWDSVPIPTAVPEPSSFVAACIMFTPVVLSKLRSRRRK